uniref:Uncharacterized protein n=1 Tax=Aegilops tauschii subsp. strangulata TaxID=200361 RepID=A0A452XBG8_AEGTS
MADVSRCFQPFTLQAKSGVFSCQDGGMCVSLPEERIKWCLLDAARPMYHCWCGLFSAHVCAEYAAQI